MNKQTTRVSTLILVVLMVLLATNTTAAPLRQTADPPGQISYQGHLLDSSNEPVDGVYSMVFRLCDTEEEEEGGQCLWSETHETVQVSAGYFSVLLGSVLVEGETNPITADILETNSYLEVSVGEDVENMETLTPRHQFGSVPFALVGGTAGSWGQNGPDVYYDEGNVGIGTTEPTAMLHVNGNGSFGEGVTSGNSPRALNVVSSDAVVRVLRITPDIDTAAPGVELIHRTTADGADTDFWDIAVNSDGFNIRDRSPGFNARVTVDNSGNVGIGTTSPGYKLEVNGTAGKPGGGSWLASSDARLKENVNDIDGREALDLFNRLQGVTFEWVNPEEHSAGTRAGLLAQNLEEVFPDWVEECEVQGSDQMLIPAGEKAKAIHFPHDFNAYLIEAIKALDAENAALQQQNADLEAQVEALQQQDTDVKARMAALETLVEELLQVQSE